MANRNFCSVESVAKAVIKVTKSRYSQELLGMLPADLFHTIITDENINQIIAKINRFRREKENAFVRRSDLEFDWKDKPTKKKKMQKLIDSSSDELTSTQKALQRQIRFLDALSRSIFFLCFVKKEATTKI